MEAYKNDYTKQDNRALWILHEIRHKMSRRSLNPQAINRSAKELIRKHRLLNLELTRTVSLQFFASIRFIQEALISCRSLLP